MSSRICGGAQVDRQVVYDKKKEKYVPTKEEIFTGWLLFPDKNLAGVLGKDDE